MSSDEDFIPRCIKLSVFFMNFLYWVLGLFTVGVGLHVQVDQVHPIQDLVSLVVSPACLMMVLGGLLFVTATFGCVGAIRENLCLLRSYLLALLFLLMIHVATGAVSFIVLFTNTSVKEGAEELLRAAILAFKEDAQMADYINHVQSSLQCCGIGSYGYKDWHINPYFQCAASNYSPERCAVPPSCCKYIMGEQINLMCGYGTTNSSISVLEAASLVYTKGCVLKIEELLQSAAVVLGVVAFGVAVPLLCGVLLSTRMIRCLETNVKNYFQKHHQINKMRYFIPSNHIYHITEPKTINVKRQTLTS